MKPLTLCAVVTTRYDLLRVMLQSALRDGYPIERFFLIDNGGDTDQFEDALQDIRRCGAKIVTLLPSYVMGLAEAWNWFLKVVPEERLIAVDDIEFIHPGTIQKMVETPGDFITASWFNCYLVRDSCIEKIGYFDETISPGYLYFEDIDYAMRLKNAGSDVTELQLGVFHHGSATMKAIPVEELQMRHHNKFLLAQRNYIKKWGSLPDWIPEA